MEHVFILDVSPDMDEDRVWREKIHPILPQIKEDILDICQYGFTEMLNNVIDHSQSKYVEITVEYNSLKIVFYIIDNGIGIFNKIQKDFNLESPKHAILELAKGKLTSDPTRHTGEGIFFTSRIFDIFFIQSESLSFFGHNNSDFIFENLQEKTEKGTGVYMQINLNSSLNIKDVFDEYTADKNDYGFSKTIVPVKLLQEGEALVSRSQAKRLIVRFEKFKKVVLDFDGVKFIGQAFADEIFRVFQNQYPNLLLVYINANDDVEKMIKHVLYKGL